MKMVLPMNIDIPVKTYNYIAFPLSVLYSNYENAADWLFNNGFSLKYETCSSGVTLNLPSDIDWNCFDRKIINPVQFNINDIVDEINEGCYVYLAVDELFIPERRCYMKENFVHDILVYGYDEEERVFYTVGHNDKKRYCCQQISFQNFKSALSSATKFLFDQNSDYEFFGIKYYFSLKLKTTEPYTLSDNIKNLKFNIERYLAGEVIQENSICYTGTLVYDKIIDSSEALSDIRNWSIIREHKFFLLNYIKNHYPFLINNLDNLDELSRTVNICHNLAIKYEINKKNNALDSLICRIKYMHALEEKLLNDILSGC